jgi:tetratricopeptide (TPR) repeat protein
MKTWFKIVTLIVFSISLNKGYSCGNEYWELLNGKLHEGGEMVGFNKIPYGQNLKKLELLELYKATFKRYKKNPTLENYTDYAATLMYKGEYQEAKAILLAIELKSPNKYNTAANLGTVYELLGQNDSALLWITKGIALNPQSHFYSEWIHRKILEEKINAGNDAHYFDTHNILNLDFGQALIPQNTTIKNPHELGEQIYYQLSERMSFIAPKDPIIAQLTFDLANIYALSKDYQFAYLTYEQAKKYGFDNDLVNKRIAYFNDLYEKERNNPSLLVGDVVPVVDVPDDSALTRLFWISVGSILALFGLFKFLSRV